jgi:AcrR family transcriptional regulator
VAGPCAPGDLLAAYVLDEATYSLSLSGLPAYRALRRLCLSRLMTGALARGAVAAGEAALFAGLVADLAPPNSIVVGAAIPRPRTKRDDIAAYAAAIIVERGVDHLTHRAVAAAANVPSSTVVYQFGARDDLVIGALEAVIAKLHASIADDLPLGTPAMLERARETARATTAVALGAIRYPKLAPHAADMRRRRGENVRADALPFDFGAQRDAFDPLTAQVFSICRNGVLLRRSALSLGPDDVENLCRRLAASADA